MEKNTAIGLQHDMANNVIFVAFWDYDENEDFYYAWTSSLTFGL